MASFDLRLEKTYWLKGFFNVPVDFQRYVTMADGPIELYLGDSSTPVVGRVTRSANRNATPRIFGKGPLIDFFRRECREGGTVRVEFLSPTAVRLNGSGTAMRQLG